MAEVEVEQSREVSSAVVVPTPRRPVVDLDPARRTHRIVVVDTDDELIAVSLQFLRPGLAAGDLTVAALTPAAAAHIRSQLPGVEVMDLPAGTLREPDKQAVHGQLLARAQEQGRRLRLLGQVQETDPRAWDERIRGEAAHEHIFCAAPMDTLCVYDRRTTPPHVLAAARRAHRETVVDGVATPNPRHLAPAELVRWLGVPVEPLQETEPVFVAVDAPSLPELRHQLATALRGRFADPDAEQDFHLAASETVANAFRHGGRPVGARVWADAERVVCTISDGGTTFDGALAGYLPAHGADLSRGGMGLWMARRLCDHVDVQRTPAGSTVRLTSAVHPPIPG